MCQIDITIHKVCTTCRTEEPLRYGPSGQFATVNERAIHELRIDPDEFIACPTCGNPRRLRIQGHPYELTNHPRVARLHG